MLIEKMAENNRTPKRSYRFTWETKRLLPFLPPKVHTLIISREGITFDSHLAPWKSFFGFHGSEMHHKHAIVLKLKKVDHNRKVVGMSQTFLIEIPETEDIGKIRAAIRDGAKQYCRARKLKGYKFKK